MKLTISISKDSTLNPTKQTTFISQEVEFPQLSLMTRDKNYSAVIYSNNIRKEENFIKAETIILDVDDGMSIEEIKKLVGDYQYLIATTKSHQKSEKNGKTIEARDRYRIIFPLPEAITDLDTFKRVMAYYINKFNADKACKDGARFYFHNDEQNISINTSGELLDISEALNDTEILELPAATIKQEVVVRSEEPKYHKISKEQEIKLKTGEVKTAEQLLNELSVEDGTVSCHCPWHDDRNPSAFIVKQETDRLFCFCSSCRSKGHYYYRKQFEYSMDEHWIKPKIDALPAVEKYKTNTEAIEKIMENIHDTPIPLAAFHDTLYFYVDGAWKNYGDEEEEKKHFVVSVLKKSLGKRPSSRLVNDLHKELRNEYKKLKAISKMINFKNGVLQLGSDEFELVPHDPSFGHRYTLDFDYDPMATCPQCDAFLEETIECPDAIKVLEEFIASAFVSHEELALDSSLLLLGNGANGKTVLTKLITALLGKENVSNLEMQQLGKETNLIAIDGKLLNVGSDSSPTVLDTSIFKKLVSGEPTLARSLYNNVYTLREIPKMIFTMNEYPKSKDMSYGFQRRFLIIPFDKVIPDEKRDRKLYSKLSTELPGLFNRVLNGYKRLMASESYTVSQVIESANSVMLKKLNPIAYFINEVELVPDSSKRLPNGIWYESYRNWCLDEGINPMSKQTVIERLKALGFETYKNNNVKGLKASLPSNDFQQVSADHFLQGSSGSHEDAMNDNDTPTF